MSTTILFTLSTFVVILFLVGILMAAIICRCNDGTAKFLAVLGVSILLIIQVGQFSLGFLMNRIASPNQVVLYHGVFSLVSSVFYVSGIGLIMLAAFRGRRPVSDEFLGPPSSVTPEDNNPYSPTH